MSYKILPYSYEKAKNLGVSIVPSHDKKKKIDVYKGDEFICSIGALGMGDYPTYLHTKGQGYADERKRLYHIRHRKDNVEGTRGYYSLNILW